MAASSLGSSCLGSSCQHQQLPAAAEQHLQQQPPARSSAAEAAAGTAARAARPPPPRGARRAGAAGLLSRPRRRARRRLSGGARACAGQRGSPAAWAGMRGSRPAGRSGKLRSSRRSLARSEGYGAGLAWPARPGRAPGAPLCERVSPPALCVARQQGRMRDALAYRAARVFRSSCVVSRPAARPDTTLVRSALRASAGRPALSVARQPGRNPPDAMLAHPEA